MRATLITGALLIVFFLGMALEDTIMPPGKRDLPVPQPAPLSESGKESVLDVAALVYAIGEVESNHNPAAVGRDGEIGYLQIRPVMVEEVNRILELGGKPPRYTLLDRYSMDRSAEMFYIYSQYWAEKNDDPSLEGMARRWNGGPDGHKEDGTLAYWLKVRARIWTE